MTGDHEAVVTHCRHHDPVMIFCDALNLPHDLPLFFLVYIKHVLTALQLNPCRSVHNPKGKKKWWDVLGLEHWK